MDPRHLYDHCLGLEPIEYVLKKILQDEKSMCVSPLFFYLSQDSLLSLILFLQGWPLDIAIKEKYACVKGIKNETSSQLAIDAQKKKKMLIERREK